MRQLMIFGSLIARLKSDHPFHPSSMSLPLGVKLNSEDGLVILVIVYRP